MFITFEGLDFCGKSTQVKLLENYLSSNGFKIEIIREPGGVLISEKIREILLDKNNLEMYDETELLLFTASRSQLVREKIIPNLKKGIIIISDRFHYSSIAYQGYGRGLDIEFVTKLQKFAVGEAIPNITFFLDIPIEEVLKRKSNFIKQDLDRIEISEADFYHKVREGYLKIASKEERFFILDGKMSKENLHDIIKFNVDKLLQEEKVNEKNKL